MKELAQKHTQSFQEELNQQNIELAVIFNPSSIYYFTGAHSFLGMDFGRPTVLIIPQSGSCSIITPLCEGAMLREMVWFDDLTLWLDGEDGE
jgi:Xaa-Pro aminopeptidase